jgi:hypothetical protein
MKAGNPIRRAGRVRSATHAAGSAQYRGEYNPTLPRVVPEAYLIVTTPGNSPRRSVIGEHDMSRLLLAGAAALTLAMGVGAIGVGTMGVAAAQTTTTSQTTTTVVPSIVAPPVGTLSTTTTKSTTSSDGTQTNSQQTTYRNSNGVADDSVTKTITYPPVAVTTTNTKTTTTDTE